MGLYLIEEYTDVDLTKFFKWFSWFTVCLIPGFIISLLYGLNPTTLILFSSWTSWMSPLQYLVFVSLVNCGVYKNTGDYSFSFCVAVISAAVSGYLYEVPRWILRDGLFGLIRTAKMSFLVLDFGMLAVPFLFYMLRDRGVMVNLLLSVSGLVYMIYMVFYTPLIEFYLHVAYPVVGLPSTVLCRVPAMWLVYQLITTKSSNK